MTCLVSLTDTPSKYHVREQNFSEEEYFVVFFDSQQGRWGCECQFQEKIGIPCAHMLRVMILSRQKILTGINPWWLLDPPSPRPRTNLTFPRKTRRN